jgi:ribonuclease HI
MPLHSRLFRKKKDDASDDAPRGVNVDVNVIREINVFALAKPYEPLVKNISPEELFPSGPTAAPNHCSTGRCSSGQVHTCERFVCTSDPHAVLVYVAGSYILTTDQKGKLCHFGGAGFIFRDSAEDPNTGQPVQRFIALRLESNGPSGEPHRATAHRAELRAFLAVLQVRDWPLENVHRLVIATDADSVVCGSIRDMRRWLINGWKHGDGGNIEDKDLWEVVWDELQYWHRRGVEVFLWHISEQQNEAAIEVAVKGRKKAMVIDFSTLASVEA